jgi:hypothetical protein
MKEKKTHFASFYDNFSLRFIHKNFFAPSRIFLRILKWVHSFLLYYLFISWFILALAGWRKLHGDDDEEEEERDLNKYLTLAVRKDLFAGVFVGWPDGEEIFQGVTRYFMSYFTG